MTEHVLSETSGGVLTLTLNRPEKKNALTRAMYQALGEAIDRAADDPNVRCVLIQADGPAERVHAAVMRAMTQRLLWNAAAGA